MYSVRSTEYKVTLCIICISDGETKLNSLFMDTCLARLSIFGEEKGEGIFSAKNLYKMHTEANKKNLSFVCLVTLGLMLYLEGKVPRISH